MNLLRNKYTVIMISLCVAIIIWLHITLSREQSAVVSLPIQYLNLPTDFPPANLPVKSRFKITGIGYEIIKIKISGFMIQYDASEFSIGKAIIDSKSFILNNYSATGIVSIEPVTENLPINNDSIITIEVPIELVFNNNEARQKFYERNFKLSQDNVEIKGIENFVRSLSMVKTKPINTSQLNINRVRIILVQPSKQIELLSPSVDIVQIDENVISKIITGVSIKNVPNYEIFPREISVRISGTPSTVKSITRNDILAELITTDEKSGEIPLKVTVPKDIRILDYTPNKVNRTTNGN